MRRLKNSFKEITRLYVLFKPYFGLTLDKLSRFIALIIILASNIISALSMVYLQDAFSMLNLIIMDPNVTFFAISGGVFGCLGPICAFGGFFMISWGVTSWLSENLDIALREEATKNLFNSELYYGIKIISHKNERYKKINFSNVINDDISQICNNAIFLLNDFSNKFFHFVVGMYQLWYLSSPLILNFLSFSFVVPGYMVLAAVSYSVIYTFLISAVDKNLKEIENKIKLNNDDLTACLHHVEEHAEAIALKKGAEKEKRGLIHILREIARLQRTRRLIASSIQFFKMIGGNISYLFGIILTSPGVIAKTLEPLSAFSVAQYFSSIVSFFTWKKDNTTTINSLNTSLDRYEAFNNMTREWGNTLKNNQLKIFHKENELTINHLSVTDPNSNLIFDDLSFPLPFGKATVIQGKSGIGKTTLLRCLSGLWPHVKGEITMPYGQDKQQTLKMYYIPQKAHFPLKSTLLEAILYPNDSNITKGLRNDTIQLMKDLKFPDKIISDLDTPDAWGDRLSGGQQQMIAVIGAILSKPDVLIIDEGTNAIDPKNRHRTEKAIRRHLNTTTVVAIDHNAVLDKKYIPFYDNKLTIKKSANDEKITAVLSEYKVNC